MSYIFWGFTGLLAFVWLLGFTTNGFMLGINIRDRIRSLPISRSDVYVCSMAMTNIFLQCWSTGRWICAFTEDKGIGCQLANAFVLIVSSCSLLMSASMCMFYCSKIVVLKNCLLQWAQKQITTYYRVLIYVAILLCVLMGLPLTWTSNDPNGRICVSDTIPCNKTQYMTSYMSIYRSIVIFIGYTMPLVYMLFSAGFIIRSLRRHMKRMHGTLKTGHEVRMEAHLQAAYTVLSLLLLFLVYFVLSLLILMDILRKGDPLLYICHSAPVLYSFVHSLIMMKGNGKQRRAAAGIMQRVKGLGANQSIQ